MAKPIHVFFDIAIEREPVGRMVFELDTVHCPLTSENFRGLCTGEFGNTNDDETKLHYINTLFFNVSKDNYIEGGDILKNTGEEGCSIYKEDFNDESFFTKHTEKGQLSMVNRGKDTNNSQFRISMRSLPYLNNKSVVFGKMVHGMELLDVLNKVKVNKQGKPVQPIIIVDCGEMGDFKEFLTKDPLNKEGMKRIREANKYNRLYFEQEMSEDSDGEKQQKQAEKEKIKQELGIKDELIDTELKLDLLKKRKNMSESKQERLHRLKLKINKAKNTNLDQIYEESEKNNDPKLKKSEKLKRYYEYKKAKQEEYKAKNIQNHTYLDKPLYKQGKKDKQDNKDNFGWNGELNSV